MNKDEISFSEFIYTQIDFKSLLDKDMLQTLFEYYDKDLTKVEMQETS